ncbi:DNA ligase 6 isoform X1 [Rhododendron vialii]|uniref:DNA ligase 6 isoform X1 n=1 Tax=Rhododendron vialii TaxID=182163 RepID=UPI00265DD0F9|nr:DNA ligase 6 isoform X1 [Rhododendron vialii]
MTSSLSSAIRQQQQPSMSTSQTVTLDSSTLFLTSHTTLSLQSPPLSFSLLSTHSPLPPLPSDFPQSKLIPRTRFIVDGFRSSGDHSVSYFLSHFHSDHYAGLNANWSKGIIFCSHTTARLLIEVLKISSLFVVPLSLSEPVLIDGCEASLIDANHCPGAVQFLFRIPGSGGGKSETYVHTGDFRYCDSMKLELGLTEFVGCDAVFLDTTYCDPKFLFPSQEESIEYIVSMIERFGVENEGSVKSVLFLVATYVIGKERILLEIARRCKRKILVDSRKLAILRVLGLRKDDAFTEEESESDVHVVGWNVLGETWPYFRPNFVKVKEIMNERGYSKVVGFVPTGWTYEVKRNKFAVRTKDEFEIHLVPYSEHSNYDELREYVRFLKPKRVIPTVGADVEKLDSKHADSMRKHFAGLVDEMAIKQEFLMGFHRCTQGTDGMVEKDSTIGQNKMDQFKEVQSPQFKPQDENDQRIVLDSLPFGREPVAQDIALLSDSEKEELIQQLRDCLPTWVTELQMIDLLSSSGGNIVDAVSNFYERELEFHNQIIPCASADCTLQTSPLNKSVSPAKPCFVNNPLGNVVASLDKKLKSPSTRNLTKSSNSTGKKRRNVDNKPNKKARSNSSLESTTQKQSTITSFFTKRGPCVSQCSGVETLLEESPNDKNMMPSDPIKSYKEELDQFIQIIHGSESLRSYAADILEETKGDINMALDKYYSNPPEPYLCENENRLVDVGRSVRDGPSHSNCSSHMEKVPSDSEALENMENLSVPILSPENAATTPVSLPAEQYSPVEHACWRHGKPAPYIHLARTFDLVEGEKGKIKATSMLCNMFRSLLALSPEDVLPAVYLCTNKIAPDHENKELNIGGSIVVAALEEACGTKRSKIKELYDSLGDLGDVAQLCRQTQSLLAPPPPLSIQGVFSVLWKISEQTGSRSTARKKSLIVSLMRSCREKEMKFLVRTLVRNLRIGAMMRTVLPALAQAVVMNASLHERTVENLKEQLQCLSAAMIESYNILPNLDLLVPCLLEKGIAFSSVTLRMVPGIPIKPMLAKITNGIPQVLKNFQNKAFTCEYKYDGQRAQIHRLADGSVRVFSRNGDETTARFPDLVNIIQESCGPAAATFIVDAEVVAVDRKNGHKILSFQELSSRERGSKDSLITVDSIKVDICVLVFDIMFANGEQLLSFPLRQRRKYFKDLFGSEKLGYFEYAKETTIEADDASLSSESTQMKMKSFLDDALSSSCEGIMVKSLDVDAGYSPSKRSDSWLKVKRDYVEGLGDSLDLVPIGAWHGNGRKAGWYSPFLVACYEPDTQEFQSVCRVMSGFSDSFYVEMKEFFSGDKMLSRKPLYYQTAEVPDMWFSPELVWEIRGADFTVSPVHKAAIGLVHPSRGISIRFPRFVRSVSDRKPEECSTSTDIADMFHSQTRKMDVSTEG